MISGPGFYFKGSMKLINRVIGHNWDSFQPYMLMKRIELIHELRAIPLEELADILKAVDPNTAVMIQKLVTGSVKR